MLFITCEWAWTEQQASKTPRKLCVPATVCDIASVTSTALVNRVLKMLINGVAIHKLQTKLLESAESKQRDRNDA